MDCGGGGSDVELKWQNIDFSFLSPEFISNSNFMGLWGNEGRQKYDANNVLLNCKLFIIF